MSRDSTDSDGLADWALVSQEGNIQEDEVSSGSSSEEFVNVTHDGVVFNRHRSSSLEHAAVPESLDSSDMSALLQSSLDEMDQDDSLHVLESELETREHFSVHDENTDASLSGSMTSSGVKSTEILTEGKTEHMGSPTILVSPNMNVASLSSQSLVSEFPVATDASDATDDASDDGAVSLCTKSLTSSGSETGNVEAASMSNVPSVIDNTKEAFEQQLDLISEENLTSEPAMENSLGDLKTEEVAAVSIAGAAVGDEDKTEVVADGEGTQWLKYPIECSSSQCHTIRLGDGRVIVAPLGADLESLAASLHLANKSETSSDTGSDSDFVRLEAISSCSSSNNNSDTEGDEASRDRLPTPAVDNNEIVEPVVDVMAESVSSVSSRFRFLPQEHRNETEAAHGAHQPVADDCVNNDGDTESVSGHSEDERTESEQSEANVYQQVEEEDRAFNDIADIPLVSGDRQYVHQRNKRLNWTLDVVVIMVVLLTVGIAIGHSIGSMREYYIQHEVNSVQLSRMSLLQEDLLQCHQKTDQLLQRSEALIQAESERRREVVEELTNTNSELRGQLDALEDEMTARATALNQCRQTEKDLRTVGTELRNEVNELRHENAEVTSRIAAMQYQTVLPDYVQSEGNAKHIEKLEKLAKQLKIENGDLRAEIARLRFLLPHSTEDIVNVEDKRQEVVEEISAVTSTSCPKTVEGHGKVRDLKARINLLEQENADMRAEIGRLRYKSYPGHTEYAKQSEERQESTARDREAEGDGIPQQVSSEEIDNLKSELHAARRQAENWEGLYMTLKERESKSQSNSTVDFLTCMKLFTHQINNSINSTTIKDFLNVTRLLLSVEDVKNVFVNEFQNIWREFSGAGNTEEEGSKEKTAQKKWSDSVKDILNKTKSSMSDMSQQIKDTWNQVKNLSEELWKKHEPALSKVATKLTQRVKVFSDHVHKKIHQKASRWFRKQQKKWKGDQDEETHGSQGKQKTSEKGKKQSTESVHETSWKHHGYQRVKSEKKHSSKYHKENHEEKMKRRQKRQEDKLKRKVGKHFQYLKKLMGKMTEKKHMKMTKKDVQEVCDFFIRFQSDWNIYKWLHFTDVQWTICQSAWWHSRLNEQHSSLGLKCLDKTYGWQMEWRPSSDEKGSFRTKRGKGFQLGKKLRRKILEKNHAAGKPYSYENEKLKQEEVYNKTEWYEQRAKDRAQYRKEWTEDRNKFFTDWYQAMMSSRFRQREEEHKSDWIFERAADREEVRHKDVNMPVNLESNTEVDPRAAWVFARAEDREYHNTQPYTWYYKRAEARQGQKQLYNHLKVDDNDDNNNDNDDDDDDEDDYDSDYGDFDPDCPQCDF